LNGFFLTEDMLLVELVVYSENCKLDLERGIETIYIL
jgi:hypothetical protein